MKYYFAYIRVSTLRQGEHGVSLQEQRAAIERYAAQKRLTISEWFEEQETAARLGRPVFSRMLKSLRRGIAEGVIIHKIDRSARNLKDWADLGQLMDDGIEVHFAHESLDLASSSGRLAADVQAVVAANYIRNLRDETKKGFYGRLKQGFYPMPAPLGYIDAGAGKPKTIDPVRGPLIREAFQLYSTGEYSQRTLHEQLYRRGLRTRTGGKVSRNTLAGILANPFYYGLIQLRQSNQSFPGQHEPLISKSLFEKAQDVRLGRTVQARPGHQYQFARMIRCSECKRSLIAETQKGHVYYRCHTIACPTKGFREEVIDVSIREVLSKLKLTSKEMDALESYLEEKRTEAGSLQDKLVSVVKLKLSTIHDRLSRLTDAYVDGRIDGEAFEQRRKTLLSERLDCERELAYAEENTLSAYTRLREFVELLKRAYLLYEYGNHDEKRDFLKMALSNREASGKKLIFTLVPELSAVAKRNDGQSGGPSAGRDRTFWKAIVDQRCEEGILSGDP